ncbi:MAG: TlpA family protein disulfide reductase [Peptococcaceae bacterium]|nr:MAG: TlpA family protein disulfide reductase [Peptococcaceae bacterium]
MNAKLVSVTVVILLLAGIFWVFSNNKEKDESLWENKEIAGEVSITAPPGTNRTLPENQLPPSFFITRANETLTLDDLKEKYIFINFWNTWCPPCQAEMPDLNRLYLQYRNKNVEFLFINITAQEKSEKAVIEFLQQNNLQLPVFLDKKGEVAGSYGIRSIPTTIVIKPNGKVVYASPGQLTYERAESLIIQ